jgi:hypothetical protein
VVFGCGARILALGGTRARVRCRPDKSRHITLYYATVIRMSPQCSSWGACLAWPILYCMSSVAVMVGVRTRLRRRPSRSACIYLCTATHNLSAQSQLPAGCRPPAKPLDPSALDALRVCMGSSRGAGVPVGTTVNLVICELHIMHMVRGSTSNEQVARA